jgi:hypothetical protein
LPKRHLKSFFVFRQDLERSGALSSSLNPSGTVRTAEDALLDLAANHVAAHKRAERARQAHRAEEDVGKSKMEAFATQIAQVRQK